MCNRYLENSNTKENFELKQKICIIIICNTKTDMILNINQNKQK